MASTAPLAKLPPQGRAKPEAVAVGINVKPLALAVVRVLGTDHLESGAAPLTGDDIGIVNVNDDLEAATADIGVVVGSARLRGGRVVAIRPLPGRPSSSFPPSARSMRAPYLTVSTVRTGAMGRDTHHPQPASPCRGWSPPLESLSVVPQNQTLGWSAQRRHAQVQIAEAERTLGDEFDPRNHRSENIAARSGSTAYEANLMPDAFGATRMRLADRWAPCIPRRNDVALGSTRRLIVEDVVTNRAHTFGESVLAQ